MKISLLLLTLIGTGFAVPQTPSNIHLIEPDPRGSYSVLMKGFRKFGNNGFDLTPPQWRGEGKSLKSIRKGSDGNSVAREFFDYVLKKRRPRRPQFQNRYSGCSARKRSLCTLGESLQKNIPASKIKKIRVLPKLRRPGGGKGSAASSRANVALAAGEVGRRLWDMCANSDTALGEMCRSVDDFFGTIQFKIGGKQRDDMYGNELKLSLIQAVGRYFAWLETMIPGRDRYKTKQELPVEDNETEDGKELADLLIKCDEFKEAFAQEFEAENYPLLTNAKKFCFQFYTDVLQLRQIQVDEDLPSQKVLMSKIPDWYANEETMEGFNSLLTLCANLEDNFGNEAGVVANMTTACADLDKKIQDAGFGVEAHSDQEEGEEEEAKALEELGKLNDQAGISNGLYFCDKTSLTCACLHEDASCTRPSMPPSHFVKEFHNCKNKRGFSWTGMRCYQSQQDAVPTWEEVTRLDNPFLVRDPTERKEWLALRELALQMRTGNQNLNDVVYFCDTVASVPTCKCDENDDQCPGIGGEKKRAYPSYFRDAIYKCLGEERRWKGRFCADS
ncbi:hypothetical protein XA68_17150 [Ophiocordyceps unilateralis]|uniref:Uncharacterized protein n=1 Tax=Ophiocordyceps unilateralis TaxID=268505 RepID=A0A2A9PKS9_OPHUN|nr:hypothetical protein XA68_17150 [Ophiocordyceps unilateralis]